MKVCPYCKREIPIDDAKLCPYCGGKVIDITTENKVKETGSVEEKNTTGIDTTEKTETGNTEVKTENSGCFAVVMTLIIIGVVIFFCSLLFNNSQNVKTDTARVNNIASSLTSGNKNVGDKVSDDIKYILVEAAQKFVKNKLSTPSTAKFPSFNSSAYSFSQNGDTWIVGGYVDAQNTYGAMVRWNFVSMIQITLKDNNQRYTATDILTTIERQ